MREPANPIHLELVPNIETLGDESSSIDRATFETWYQHSVDDVFGFLARRVGSDHAEDLTAEVYIRAWKNRHTYQPSRGAPRAWLFGIANNLVHDHRRRERRQLRAYARAASEVVTELSDSQLDAALAVADMDLLRPLVARALSSLSDDERDILWLHASGDLSYAEIAEALDIAVGTVRSRLSRARSRLARVLSAKKEIVNGVS